VFTGTLWLDYTGDDGESHYEARVSRTIVREEEIVLEFSGHDPDDGPFSGHCKLTKLDAFFVGLGTFIVDGKPLGASVRAVLKRTNAELELVGTWHDIGDRNTYELSVDLEESGGRAT
jgi:hypothetical protein